MYAIRSYYAQYAHVIKIALSGVVISEPLVDTVGDKGLTTIRLANHSDKEQSVNVKVDAGGEVIFV